MRPHWVYTLLVWHPLHVVLARASTISQSSLNQQSACSSTTINYITQTLPQQCLRTDWSRSSSGNSSTEAQTTTSSQTFSVSDDGLHEPVVASTSLFSVTSPSSDSVAEISGWSASVASQPGDSVAAVASLISEEEEEDPLTDHGSFLSFEEWKAQMLERSGQSPDNIIGSKFGQGSEQARQQQVRIENALDSFGDEEEIELDFSGFVNSETTPNAGQNRRREDVQSVDGPEGTLSPPMKRSKEAGTTSRERFNYASFDCAATILKTSDGSKGATWILSENKDNYLLNKCSQKDKYFIVELCSDILIDTIVLGNFEFFSSTFRTFRVSISDRYPVKADKWRELGIFEANNNRGIQAFLVENGLMWGRYLKVELLTHYGSEYYCPVSLLRVHGKPMMDHWRTEMKGNEQDTEDDDSVPEHEQETIIAEAVPILPLQTHIVQSVQVVEKATSTVTVIAMTSSSPSPQQSSILVTESNLPAPTSAWRSTFDLYASRPVCKASEFSVHRELIQPSPLISDHPSFSSSLPDHETDSDEAVISPTSLSGRTSSIANITAAMITTTPSFASNTTEPDSSPRDHHSTQSTQFDTPTASSTTESSQISTEQVSSTLESIPTTSDLVAGHDAVVSPTGSSYPITLNSTTTQSKSSKISTPIKASPATPSTQDSFFRTVQKRLQMLEANSTLSLQYIEEQSRILRDAFSKAEKRQLTKTAKFLETLNGTVLSELRNFRIQYDQIWQSTVLELASQREQSQKEVQALGERLGLMADELVWQKRVAYLQFILIVISLGLIIFSRNGLASGSGAPLELSLLQSIQSLGKSGASVSFAERYPSSLESPPGTPSRPSSIGGLFARRTHHRRHLSDGITSGEEVNTGTTASPERRRETRLSHLSTMSDETTLAGDTRSKSPSVNFEPMTPRSERDEMLGGPSDATFDSEYVEADPLALRRAVSSPALGRKAEDDEGSADLDSTGEGGSAGANVESLQVPVLAGT